MLIIPLEEYIDEKAVVLYPKKRYKMLIKGYNNEYMWYEGIYSTCRCKGEEILLKTREFGCWINIENIKEIEEI